MADLRITAVQAFLAQPQGARLIVVKVLTSEPGLFGLGCATFTQRHRAVEAAIRHHTGPFAIGKDPRNVEDLWHAMMVSVHMDLALHNLGIQEWSFPNQAVQDMFPGLPEARAGYAWANDRPGLGVDFDQALAAKFPCDDANPAWTVSRLPDGTLWRP